MIQAVTNASVPQITIYCGAFLCAGNYGMCGRGSIHDSVSLGQMPRPQLWAENKPREP